MAEALKEALTVALCEAVGETVPLVLLAAEALAQLTEGWEEAVADPVSVPLTVTVGEREAVALVEMVELSAPEADTVPLVQAVAVTVVVPVTVALALAVAVAEVE